MSLCIHFRTLLSLLFSSLLSFSVSRLTLCLLTVSVFTERLHKHSVCDGHKRRRRRERVCTCKKNMCNKLQPSLLPPSHVCLLFLLNQSVNKILYLPPSKLFWLILHSFISWGRERGKTHCKNWKTWRVSVKKTPPYEWILMSIVWTGFLSSLLHLHPYLVRCTWDRNFLFLFTVRTAGRTSSKRRPVSKACHERRFAVHKSTHFATRGH